MVTNSSLNKKLISIFNFIPENYYKYNSYNQTTILKWLSQFNIIERKYLDILLKSLKYYSYEDLKKSLRKLWAKMKNFNLDYNHTLFISSTFFDKENHISDLFFAQFLVLNKLIQYKNNLMPINIFDLMSQYENIVIIDDFSGSGQNIIECISALLNYLCLLRNKIYILVPYITKNSYSNITRYCLFKNIKFKIVYLEFHNVTFSNINNKIVLQVFKNIYSYIYDGKKLEKKFKFGRNYSLAQISFYYNVPNNTIGLYWYTPKDSSYLSLFNRVKKNELFEKFKSKSELFSNPSFTANLKRLYETIIFVKHINDQYLYSICSLLGKSVRNTFKYFYKLVDSNFIKIIQSGKVTYGQNYKEAILKNKDVIISAYRYENEKNSFQFNDFVYYKPK